MKNSEKLFNAINNIDEELIDEAKPEEQKPVQVKIKKRFPIKEIALFAACFAVLAGAVFGIVKYRIDHSIQTPEQPSDVSSDISNSDPMTELTFTDEDRELQAILKDLTAKGGEVDRMFYQMSVIDGEPDLKTEWGNYYIISEELRTEPDGLFAVPRSVGVTEGLIHALFSSLAAESYLSSDNVCKGKFGVNSDGKVLFEPDDIQAGANPTFIEVDGKMYRSELNRDDYSYSNLGIDCDTAKVTRRSDKAMEFSYWGYDYPSRYDGGDVYSERNGAIVYENGAWRLHYFKGEGFIPEMPVEYTEQDLKLHVILDALKPGNDVRELFSFNSAPADGTAYKFILPGNNEPEGSYVYYVDVSGPQTITNHPKSLAELENMLLEYFTREATDNYMSSTCRGTMTENGDGTYSITLDKAVLFPVYIEIDGKMFYRMSDGSGESALYDTAKVVDWTDRYMITYTYVYAAPGGYSTETGALRYERGGWKYGSFDDPDTNKELREILSDILPNAIELENIFRAVDPGGEKVLFVNDRSGDHAYYRPITDDMRTQPDGRFKMPQNRAELEELLSGYFTKRAVKTYMDEYATGSMTAKPDGSYSVTSDKTFFTDLIEIDGQLYCRIWDSHSAGLNFNIETASVLSHTDTVFKFSHENSDIDDIGTIVYEDGSWKLNFFCGYGFSAGYPTEFTAEDEELQAILNEISPGEAMIYWFGGVPSHDTRVFIFNGMESTKGEYVKLSDFIPSGRFYGSEEECPHTYEELHRKMLVYLTEEITERYFEYANKGTITSETDGIYNIKTEVPSVNGSTPRVIEIDGDLYLYAAYYIGGAIDPDWDSAQLISKTDDTIEFTYCNASIDYLSENGTLKFERGGWKLSDYYDPFKNYIM